MNTLLNTLFVIRRLLATAIDGLLVFAFTLGLLAVSAFIAAHTFPAFSVPDGVEAAKWYEGVALSLAPYFLITIPLGWLLYEATLTKIWNGTTLGKFLLRIRTISVAGNMTFWQSLLRTTLKVLSMFLLLSVANPYALAIVLVAFLAFPVFTAKYSFLTFWLQPLSGTAQTDIRLIPYPPNHEIFRRPQSRSFLLSFLSRTKTPARPGV